MKLPYKVNPAHVASKDQTRYVLNGVFLTGNLAVATDGRMLIACIGQREDGDDPRDAIIPTKAALAGFKNRKRGIIPVLTVLPKVENCQLECRVMTSLDETTTFREVDGNFPHVDRVVPDPAKHTLKVALNVHLLSKLAKALGEETITIHLDPEGFKPEPDKQDGKMMTGSPLIVTAKSGEAVGILMPCRTHDLLRHNKTFALINETARARHAEQAREAAEAETTTTEPTATTPQ